MKQLLETDQWSDLAVRVLTIGYKDNLAWYYLGRAAEGLGHIEAARTYFKRPGQPHEVRRAVQLL